MDFATLAIIGGGLAALVGAASGGAKARAVESRGKQAVDIARREWALDVREPVTGVGPFGADRIDAYIRGPFGLTWGGADVSDLSDPVPYTRDGQFEWCGAFAAWVLGQVGLSRTVRKRHLASTYRLFQWSKDNARRIPLNQIQPGDIVVVGPANDPIGKHARGVQNAGRWHIRHVRGERRRHRTDRRTHHGCRQTSTLNHETRHEPN